MRKQFVAAQPTRDLFPAEDGASSVSEKKSACRPGPVLNLATFDAQAGRVVEGHGILQPRVTPTLAETGCDTVARVLGPARHRSLCLSRVRRLPGPLRGGHLHRQGDLRRGRLRARARRARPGEHAAVARSLRGHLRASRIRLRRRALRRLPATLRGGRGATAPVGAGRLAAPSLDPRGPRAARRDDHPHEPVAHAIPVMGR